MEFIIGFFVLLLLGIVFVVPVIALVRTFRIGGLEQRLARIEKALGRRSRRARRGREAQPGRHREKREDAQVEPLEAVIPAEEVPAPPRRPAPIEPRRPRFTIPETSGMESWLGQKFMGWAAVVLLLLATGFFLQYTFSNKWIGELGRVTIGILAGAGLCAGGLVMHQRRGWLASQMLTSAGIVLLYLSTFAAFGFYHLMPRDHASIYFVLIVVQAALLAGLYNAEAIGIMAIVGGLLSPILLRSDVDQYRNLFLYLTILNLGAAALALWRRWITLAPLALIGTQGLFWLWWADRYHPAKFAIVLTFQLVTFGLFLIHDLIAPVILRRRAHPVQLVSIVVNALALCLACYFILEPDYHLWLPALAMALGATFAGLVWMVQKRSPDDAGLQLTPLAVALSMIATAIALRGEAGWIALGWAVEGAALWWVGLRLRQVPLRLMATALLLIAVGRILFLETPATWNRTDFWLLLNPYALPGLIVAACLLVVARITRLAIPSREGFDTFAYWAGGLGGVLLGWMVLSIDVYQFGNRWWHEVTGGDGSRFASTSLTVVWTAYAGLVLFFGFLLDSRPVRLTAMGLFFLTLGKVMLIDVARLPGFYRVAAFFVLALVMGLAAYAYQRRFAKEHSR